MTTSINATVKSRRWGMGSARKLLLPSDEPAAVVVVAVLVVVLVVGETWAPELEGDVEVAKRASVLLGRAVDSVVTGNEPPVDVSATSNLFQGLYVRDQEERRGPFLVSRGRRLTVGDLGGGHRIDSEAVWKSHSNGSGERKAERGEIYIYHSLEPVLHSFS
jgi:hypothetical protein